MRPEGAFNAGLSVTIDRSFRGLIKQPGERAGFLRYCPLVSLPRADFSRLMSKNI